MPVIQLIIEQEITFLLNLNMAGQRAKSFVHSPFTYDVTNPRFPELHPDKMQPEKNNKIEKTELNLNKLVQSGVSYAESLAR